jgi:hypothetical protein
MDKHSLQHYLNGSFTQQPERGHLVGDRYRCFDRMPDQPGVLYFPATGIESAIKRVLEYGLRFHKCCFNRNR